MPPIPTPNLDFLERVAVARVRQKREQYLEALDELLTSFGIAGEAASLDGIRVMFTRYENPACRRSVRRLKPCGRSVEACLP